MAEAALPFDGSAQAGLVVRSGKVAERRRQLGAPLRTFGSMGGVEVIDDRGNAVATTGSWVNMSGGHWTDGSFLACGEVR